MSLKEQVKHGLNMVGHALLKTIHVRLDDIEKQTAENQSVLLQSAIHMVEGLHEVNRNTFIDTNEFNFLHPEFVLLQHLYSYLPARRIAGTGERFGELRSKLEEVGFETIAAPSLSDLQKAIEPGWVAYVSAEMTHPEFPKTGGRDCPVVAAMFRESFSESVFQGLRANGYPWHIVLYRTAGRDDYSFYANYGQCLDMTRGTILFFRDHVLFTHALEWCCATLPRTFFSPIRTE
jgi:hypothetical protein